MNEISLTGRLPVDSYGPGGFRIAGAWHEGSVIVSPRGLMRFELPLDAETVQPVLAQAGELDVVLVGQGAEIAPLPGALRALFEEAGIGVEVMNTASACRTYNVLLAEDRRVAVILTAV